MAPRKLADYSDDSSSASSSDSGKKREVSSSRGKPRDQARSRSKDRGQSRRRRKSSSSIRTSKRAKRADSKARAMQQSFRRMIDSTKDPQKDVLAMQEKWLKKEDEFEKKQLLEQSKFRIEKRRERPIDLFVKILLTYKGQLPDGEDDSTDIFKRPAKLFELMTKEEIQGISKIVDQYKNIEVEAEYQRFWDNIKILAATYLNELIKHQQKESGRVHVSASVSEDYKKEVEAALAGKTLKELEELELQARNIFNSKEVRINVEFWENMLKKILVKKAELELEALYQAKLKASQEINNSQVGPIDHVRQPFYAQPQIRDPGSPKLIRVKRIVEKVPEVVVVVEGEAGDGNGKVTIEENTTTTTTNNTKTTSSVEENIDQNSEAYNENDESLGTSEMDFSWANLESDEDFKLSINQKREDVFETELSKILQQLRDTLEERKRMEEARESSGGVGFSGEGFNRVDNSKGDIPWFKNIQNQNTNEDEGTFNLHAREVQKDYDWIEKFRPRKPHYFNRVKMGYEWNKVHQTHYDLDNPPPKEVLGYKFNIFYPNLIDPSKIPTYTREALENHEFCLIRFSGGPPYEDIAFKIVNREWDLTDRHGFKCVFDHGFLHLHFNFVKVRYRR